MELDYFKPEIWVCIPYIIILLVVWELVWKFIALWKSARNNQLGWFICIAVINMVGILPIIYLLTHKKNNKPEN